jgi:hypothetical protein
MHERTRLAELACSWSAYLGARHHRVRLIAEGPLILSSRNGQGRRYRWVLFCGDDARRKLTPSERLHVQRELKHAKTRGERVFLVVVFPAPISKLVVWPAAKALGLPRLSGAKGGIQWED